MSQSSTTPIPGCTCDPSCTLCGYDSAPDTYRDCITCSNGGAVTPVYGDGTGTCSGVSGLFSLAAFGLDPKWKVALCHRTAFQYQHCIPGSANLPFRFCNLSSLTPMPFPSFRESERKPSLMYVLRLSICRILHLSRGLLHLQPVSRNLDFN